MYVMGEEVPKEPPQIGDLQEAPEALFAPPYPNNCWKVFNHLKRSLVCRKEFIGTLLGLALRLRLRRSVILGEYRAGRGLYRLVRWRRVVGSFCYTPPILRFLVAGYQFFFAQANSSSL
jgi:hypothetical protein